MILRSTTAKFSELEALLQPKKVECNHYNCEIRSKYEGKYEFGKRQGKKFEDYAFARLFDEKDNFGIEKIYRCENSRVDGFLKTSSDDRDVILLEMKYTLGWNSLGLALTEFLTGRNLLIQNEKIISSHHGLIVFENFSSDWIRSDKRALRPWAQLYRHLDELSNDFKISVVQLSSKSFDNPLFKNIY